MAQQKRLFTAYIDLPFLRRFLRGKADPIEEDDTEWVDTWQSVYSFLRRHTQQIVVDGREEEVFSSDTLKSVLLSSGQPDVQFEPGISDQIDGQESWIGDDPFCVFLFGDCEKSLESLRKETGLLFLNYESLKERWLSLFQPSTIDLHGDTASFDWEEIVPHARPLNSILIVDRYAYHQLASRTEFARNLGGLLEALLSDQNPSHSIDIAIFTDLQKAIDEDGREIANLFKTGRGFFDNRLSTLNLRFRLLGLQSHSEDHHEDRLLFTNYGFFLSGDSFDYFQEGGTKDTLLSYLPLKGHEPEALRRLRRFSMIDFEPPEAVDRNGDPIRLAQGDLGNRLLAWVQNRAS
jgi:hypothetical protein